MNLAPFAQSALHAYRLTADAAYLPAQPDLITAAAVSVSMISISMRVAHVAEVRGLWWALWYAVFLVMLAYTLAQVALGRLLSRLCKECPRPGLLSMAAMCILLAALLEGAIFHLVT